MYRIDILTFITSSEIPYKCSSKSDDFYKTRQSLLQRWASFDIFGKRLYSLWLCNTGRGTPRAMYPHATNATQLCYSAPLPTQHTETQAAFS